MSIFHQDRPEAPGNHVLSSGREVGASDSSTMVSISTRLFPASRTLIHSTPRTKLVVNIQLDNLPQSHFFARKITTTQQQFRMSNPIPYATLGRDGQVAAKLHTLLMPEYELVHACLNLEQARAELPNVCSGVLDTSIASKIGTNVDRPVAERKTPKALVFGGGIPDQEVDAVMAALKEKQPPAEVKVVRVTREDILATGAPGPSPEAIAQVLRQKLGALVQNGEL
ncbi:hypothetical protein N657DRAFT_644599 [Parathielavia appendiculata]|uniref:Uncharacterized protein n=1 Tax=Parathielavia appendiculata TaxID=2587402 RepID=A0AAN6U220_9PEZI|nr:hypothetical protein N657DRAFT_644599 [Parathielavia appendiculata]